MDEILSTRDAARVLGVEPSTLKKWRLEGRGLPWVEVSTRKCVYRRDDVLRFMDERTRRPWRASTSSRSAASLVELIDDAIANVKYAKDTLKQLG